MHATCAQQLVTHGDYSVVSIDPTRYASFSMFKTVLASKRMRQLLIAVVVIGIAGCTAIWFYRDALMPYFTQVGDGLWAFLKGTHPVVFFSAFAVLPAFGFPISAFYLMAAALYPLGVNLAACTLGLLCSMTIGYWLAAGIFKPLLEKLLARTKHRVPKVYPDEQASITLLIRITPGMPFMFQNFILGLAEVRYKTYILVSWPIQIAWAIALLVLGESAFEGRASMAVFGGGLLIALIIITKIARKRYAARSNRSEPAA